MTPAMSAGSPTGTSTPRPLACTNVDDAEGTLTPEGAEETEELYTGSAKAAAKSAIPHPNANTVSPKAQGPRNEGCCSIGKAYSASEAQRAQLLKETHAWRTLT